MQAVYKKELGQLFHSVIGYVYLGIFLLIGGGYFVLYNLLPANGDIRNFFSPMMSTVIFLLPMLTMRSYSEERKMRTDRLLMSAPVSPLAIALGKFFAVLTIFAAGLAFTLLYVLVLAMKGRFDLMMVLGNYVGMLVAAGAFIAIGLFISTLTENQIIACITTYAVLLGLWLVGFAESYIPNAALKALAGWLSVADRFAEFSMGIFDLSTIVYYVSITAFFLFAITLVDEKRRQA